VYHSGLGERGGAVVNVASIAGLAPSPGIGWYGSTKALVGRLTQELAVELGPAVPVNAVAPGVVKTNSAEALYSGREEWMSAALPVGCLGVSDVIAGPVAFLPSDDAHWLTGQTLVVDGGAHIVRAGLGGGAWRRSRGTAPRPAGRSRRPRPWPWPHCRWPGGRPGPGGGSRHQCRTR